MEAANLEAANPEPASPTLRTLLSGDTCDLVVLHLGLADLAALTIVLLPAHPRELSEAIEAHAARCLALAPLCCVAESFATAAIWPVSVAACNWHPREFFGNLRAPAYCRVAGSGTCSHGLCQKQEQPKQGVVEVLEWLARDAPPLLEATADAPAAATGPSTRVLSLECLAWLHGALGRGEAALEAWARAARAGSARALLDLGVRSYGEGTASVVYTMPSTPAGCKRRPPCLRTAARRPTAPSGGPEPACARFEPHQALRSASGSLS